MDYVWTTLDSFILLLLFRYLYIIVYLLCIFVICYSVYFMLLCFVFICLLCSYVIGCVHSQLRCRLGCVLLFVLLAQYAPFVVAVVVVVSLEFVLLSCHCPAASLLCPVLCPFYHSFGK